MPAPPNIAGLLRSRETGAGGRRGRWRAAAAEALSLYALPEGGGVVWIVGTKNRRDVLRGLLGDRPDHMMVSRPGQFTLAAILSYCDARPGGGTVVLDGVVRSVSWLHDDALCRLILDRPPGLTVVACVDVPIHATDEVLRASRSVAVLPSGRKHFAPLAYRRYFSQAIDRAEFDRTWGGLKSGQILTIDLASGAVSAAAVAVTTAAGGRSRAGGRTRPT